MRLRRGFIPWVAAARRLSPPAPERQAPAASSSRSRRNSGAKGKGASKGRPRRGSPTPPRTVAGTSPRRDAVTPGLKFAKLVGRPDEERIHGAHPPAHLVRRLKLDERAADDDADRVRRPERPPALRTTARTIATSPNTIVATPNAIDRRKHPVPDPPPGRPADESDRHRQRSDGGRRPQCAEAPCAHSQNVAGVDRKERGGASEQDCEQVERDAPENHRIASGCSAPPRRARKMRPAPGPGLSAQPS
jgi:hypothetical protein